MSISKDGKVRISALQNRNTFVVWILLSAQFILSIVLCVSLAAHIIWPESSRGAAGTPMKISYEGRLTDSSGNSLGGTGTPYCFRLSIYDSVSSGSKMWPVSTPATTMGTTTDGVFSVQIGQADTLTSSVFDFSTTSVSYLQVDVNTTPSTCAGSWESLSPRQEILSSPYALQSNNVYGALLKTDTVNNRVQVGTGVGAANPVYLGLDWKNTADAVGQSCTTNGLMWYNSATSHALICEANVIQELGTVATTTIGAITANSGTPATTGTINFSNSNGVSFGINGNTITASVNAGGGGATLQSYEPYPALSLSSVLSSNSNTSGFASFLQFNVGNYVQADFMNLVGSISFVTIGTSAGSQSYTMNYGIYSRGAGGNSTILSQITSSSFSLAVSYSNSTITISQPTSTNTLGFTYGTASSAGLNVTSGYTGMKAFQLPLNSVMAPGAYWLGLMNRISTTSFNPGVRISIAGMPLGASVVNLAPIGSFSTAFSNGTNATRNIGGNWYMANGSFSSAGQTNLPSTVAVSAITGNISVRPYMRFYAST